MQSWLISWSDDDVFTQRPEQSSYTYQLRPIILLPLSEKLIHNLFCNNTAYIELYPIQVKPRKQIHNCLSK